MTQPRWLSGWKFPCSGPEEMWGLQPCTERAQNPARGRTPPPAGDPRLSSSGHSPCPSPPEDPVDHQLWGFQNACSCPSPSPRLQLQLCGCVCVSLPPAPLAPKHFENRQKELSLFLCIPRPWHGPCAHVGNVLNRIQCTPCLHPAGGEDGREAQSRGCRCYPHGLTVTLLLLLLLHHQR